MAGRTTLDVARTPDLEKFDSDQEMTRQAQLERLRSQVNLGLDQANRGELLNGEEVFEELARYPHPKDPRTPQDLLLPLDQDLYFLARA